MKIKWFGRLFLLFPEPADEDEYMPRVMLGRQFENGRPGAGVKKIVFESDGPHDEGFLVIFEDGSWGAVLFYSYDEDVAQLLSRL
jgi:hypothetical protein